MKQWNYNLSNTDTYRRKPGNTRSHFQFIILFGTRKQISPQNPLVEHLFCAHFLQFEVGFLTNQSKSRKSTKNLLSWIVDSRLYRLIKYSKNSEYFQVSHNTKYQCPYKTFNIDFLSLDRYLLFSRYIYNIICFISIS